MMMHNPPHPGLVVKNTLIEGADLTITQAAELLDVSRLTVSKLINCKSGISPEMAVRLSMALNTSSEMWLNMQLKYDLYHAEKNRRRLKVKPVTLLQKANRHI